MTVSFVLAPIVNHSLPEREANKLSKLFFPKNNEGKKGAPIQDLALLRLWYLAFLGDNPQKSPFTKKQISIIQINDQKNCQTTGGLWVGVIINSLGTGALGYVTLLLTDKRTEAQKLGILTAAAFIAVCLGILSYWATGFSPDSTRFTADACQDMESEMKEVYSNLGHRLIRLYYSTDRQSAISIANQIDLARLKRTIENVIHSPIIAGLIVAHLREAIGYIRSGERQIPATEAFADFIESRKIKWEATRHRL